jgi:hypothetical protein
MVGASRAPSARQLIAASRPGGGEDNSDLWKALGTDTEAGRMLRKLYGGRPNRALEFVPQPRVNPSLAVSKRRPFIPAGASLDAEDPRKASVDHDAAAAVEVPPDYDAMRRLRWKPPALIDTHAGKRRSKASIDVAETRAARLADRAPTHGGNASGTDLEKRKLQLAFQFKGGKSLPPSVAADPLEGEVPMSLVLGRPVRGRRAPKADAAATAASSPGRKHGPSSAYLFELLALFDDVLRSVEEEKDLLRGGRGASGTGEPRSAIRARVEQKIGELDRLEQAIDAERARLSKELA